MNNYESNRVSKAFKINILFINLLLKKKNSIYFIIYIRRLDIEITLKYNELGKFFIII